MEQLQELERRRSPTTGRARRGASNATRVAQTHGRGIRRFSARRRRRCPFLLEVPEDLIEDLLDKLCHVLVRCRCCPGAVALDLVKVGRGALPGVLGDPPWVSGGRVRFPIAPRARRQKSDGPEHGPGPPSDLPP